MLQRLKFILPISVLIIWLFTISGIIGIAIGYEDWFLGLTPLHLSLYLVLILVNSPQYKKLLLALCIPFGIGMLAEILGVNYGWIFGTYQYGDNLGYKVLGVPWMIGINWALLVYSTAAIARRFLSNRWLTALLAAVLMVALDLIIEVSAPRFDFWEFEGGVVPLQNYIGWLVTAYIAHYWFQQRCPDLHHKLAIHIFMAILVFFTSFLFI